MNDVLDLSFDIAEYDFSANSLFEISGNRWVNEHWPLVYFIQSKHHRIAYVGETTNAYDRIIAHLKNEKRSFLNKISIIGSDKFNKSATLEIESQLIQYIISEGSISLQNGNNGLSHHNYYQRELYKNLFTKIWNRLIEKKLVSKSLDEIEKTNLFKYSPYKSLDQYQLNSVLEIIENLNKKETSQIFVKGSAGTGKTILATYLMKLLTSRVEDLNTDEITDENFREIELVSGFKNKYPNPSIALVVAMTSLRETLQDVFSKIPGLNSAMVISPTETFKKHYDILIVDEAHRLRQRKNISWMGVFTRNNNKLALDNNGTELDWILSNSKHQIFFYDADQSIKPSDVPQDRFDLLLKKSTTARLELKSQFRVNGGTEYIEFVDDLLNCRLNNRNSTYKPKNYELQVFESIIELYSQLTKKESEHKLCRLIAGYSWPWISRNKSTHQDYDIEIEGLKFCWNRTDKDWINSNSSFTEIGCIHTTQGRDLNYAGIIFGKEIIYNPVLERIEIIPQNYFDRNGKAGIVNSEDLKTFIINIYKTLMYRAKLGTYVYACDENLRKYLQRSIFQPGLNAAFRILRDGKMKPSANCIPFYDISVAAGNFSERQNTGNAEWLELPKPYKAKEDYFACKVVGESMNKKIPSGSWCLFQKDRGGSREGKIVLVEHYSIQDPDCGSGFTIKLYHSEKEIAEDGWSHKAIVLKPLSLDSTYKDIILQNDQVNELMVVGIFLKVLE